MASTAIVEDCGKQGLRRMRINHQSPRAHYALKTRLDTLGSMPHSWHFPTTLIQDKVQRLAPQSVVDVGAGYGKWGFLLHEQLDWNPGRLDRDRWTARIVGVEVYPYESPLHGWVYDEVLRADVLDVIDRIDGYDLVLLSDVIEHIEKGPALGLLRRLVAQNRNVIVCTPLDFFEQEIADNEHEHHISHWTIDDFAEFVFDYDTAGGRRWS